MRERAALYFKRGDAVVAALVLLCAAALSVALIRQGLAAGRAVARVYQDGQLLRELSLERNASFSVSGQYTNLVTVQDGRVAITQSDCPGGDCVHSGWLSSPGRSVVCLPNRVEVRLTGASQVDAATG